MGLSAKHRRTLDTIESALQSSDPGLAARFAVFTRLTLGEEMPRVEHIRRRADQVARWARRRLTTGGRWLSVRPRRWVRTAIFLPLALGLVAASFALSPRYLGSARCASMLAATRPVRPARARHPAPSCAGMAVRPLFFGK